MIRNPNDIQEGAKKIRMLIAGYPGIGKSTLALSAPNPLHIDVDFGIDRIEPRYRKPYIQPQSYDEILGDLTPINLQDFDTLVFDTGGKLIDFWTDSKVVDDFTPEDRYIYLYCMTNPHTNLCGCYEVSIKQIANETGYNNDSVERLLKRLDSAHNVIRYSAQTKELLILNWCRYNWSTSEKLNKPLLGEIRKVKNDRFREYLAARYNERSTVTAQYNAAEDDRPEVPRHKHGAHGWVRLTEEEYARLIDDLGEEELTRCIDYIDESAQMHGNKNKWRDWNLVIRKCSRERWGIRGGNGSRPSASGSAMDDLQQLHQMYASEESL